MRISVEMGIAGPERVVQPFSLSALFNTFVTASCRVTLTGCMWGHSWRMCSNFSILLQPKSHNVSLMLAGLPMLSLSSVATKPVLILTLSINVAPDIISVPSESHVQHTDFLFDWANPKSSRKSVRFSRLTLFE